MGNSIIPCTVDGIELPLRESESQYGNAVWSLQGRKADGSRYNPGTRGINLEGIFEAMPQGPVDVLGTSVTLVADENDNGRPRVKGEAKVVVPNHGTKVFEFRVTEVADGVFNTAISVHGKGGTAGGGKRHHLDDL